MRTQIVLTNAEAAQAEDDRKQGVAPKARGVEVDIRAHDDGYPQGPSVWDERRKLWPAFVAAVVAALAMMLSGWNLLVPADVASEKAGWRDGPGAACSFAMQQLATVSPWPVDIRRLRPDCEVAPAGGLRNAAVADRYRAASPGWAMAWDFVFIVGFGYLIARLASRVFTWFAGWRRPGQPRSRWLLAAAWLPALAVGADALENIGDVALRLALPHLGMPSFGTGRAVRGRRVLDRQTRRLRALHRRVRARPVRARASQSQCRQGGPPGERHAGGALGPVTHRSPSAMSTKLIEPRNIKSSFSKREKMRRWPLRRRNKALGSRPGDSGELVMAVRAFAATI